MKHPDPVVGAVSGYLYEVVVRFRGRGWMNLIQIRLGVCYVV